MARKPAFNADSITDQKRLVRGEHWIMARRLLRVRDGVHHGFWRCLIVAGPTPKEEIDCIRALMQRAYIIAVDIDEGNISAAIEAGADDVAFCNLSDYQEIDAAAYPRTNKKKPPSEIGDTPFDVICLDLTCSASEWLAELVSVYARSVSRGGPLAKGGVFIVNFSYGRDVVERLIARWKSGNDLLKVELDGSGISDAIASRVFAVLKTRMTRLRSVLQYRGNAMPMLSCLLVERAQSDRSVVDYVKISDDDYAEAVTAEDIGNIYACPAKRIAALRRRKAALKAVHTRTIKASRINDLFKGAEMAVLENGEE